MSLVNYGEHYIPAGVTQLSRIPEWLLFLGTIYKQGMYRHITRQDAHCRMMILSGVWESWVTSVLRPFLEP